MSNQVATKKNAELSADLMDDILEFAGDGTSFDSSEMQIPFLRVVQALSPQLSKNKPEYIKGVELGDMFNTVTNEVFKGDIGVIVIPCYQVTKYLSFTPRDLGGGFRGEIEPNDPVLTRTTRDGPKEILPTGDELVKSDQHYSLLLATDGSYQPIVIDMKSTQLKVSRRWKTMIAMQSITHPKTGQMIKPPVFATMWRLTTTEESNKKGDWANYKVEKHGLVNDRNLMLEAKAFRDSVAAGEVKAASEERVPTSSSTQTNVNSLRDEDIPF
tara:strand:+ start:568 stop:1380 length:813 start_codon:yes stop_codon:yes gene_type:complete